MSGERTVGEEELCNILEIKTERMESPQLYRIEDETEGSALEKKIWSLPNCILHLFLCLNP